MLTGAFGNELLCPCAEAINRLVNDEGHLVATLTRERPHDAAECKGVVSGRLWIATLRDRCASRSEERIKIDTEERRRHKTNKAQG